MNMLSFKSLKIRALTQRKRFSSSVGSLSLPYSDLFHCGYGSSLLSGSASACIQHSRNFQYKGSVKIKRFGVGSASSCWRWADISLAVSAQDQSLRQLLKTSQKPKPHLI